MTQQITITAVTKEPKLRGDETMWGVKVGNSWMDLHVTDKPAKGSMAVETWEVESKNGRKFVHARPVAGQQAAPTQQQASSAPARSNGNRPTTYGHSFTEYCQMAERAHAFALILEPGESGARARTALVSTFLIAFGNGQLALEPSDDWGDVASNGAQPVKYEKTAGHTHLEKTIWAYFERIGGTADGAIAMLKEVSGKTDVLELSEKEAIQARLKAEKIIDEKTDYLALFTTEAKKIATKEGWDFAGKDPVTISNKKALLIKAGITKPFKDLTQADLKAAVQKLTDDVSH